MIQQDVLVCLALLGDWLHKWSDVMIQQDVLVCLALLGDWLHK